MLAVTFLLCISLIPGIGNTKGEPGEDANYGTILYFVKTNPVFEARVQLGTSWENLNLPAELRAVVNLAEKTTNQIEDFAFASKTNLASETNLSNLSTTADIVFDIPVIWKGEYDANIPGIYMFTAQIDNFNYYGAPPTAFIIVEPEESATEPEEPATEPEESEANDNLLANGAVVLSRNGKYTYTDVIDLSFTRGKTGPGFAIAYRNPGYADYDSRFLYTDISVLGTLSFTAGANGKTYCITQTGVPNPGIGKPEKGPNYGTSAIYMIIVDDNVNVTLVVNNIHILASIKVAGTGKLTLILDETNYVRDSIEVPNTAELLIDSMNENDIGDLLVIPSDNVSKSNNAKIGGPANTGAGKITISGGNIDIVAHSSGAGIGGGGRTSSTGSAGGAGTITITGGTVSVVQYGSGGGAGQITPWSQISSGAGIGGGGQESDFDNSGTGNILITGGTVTVRQYTRAAGIGAGTFSAVGNITIQGGNIDAEVIRLENSSGAGEGAAIGGCAGTNPATGSITINGGTIRAVAAFTGIGWVHTNNTAMSITVTGGNVYAKGTHGPGIGYWNKASGNSIITITGGTVIAESDNSTGIGENLELIAKFYLDAAANVRAYAGGTLPALNVGDNLGNGYYVNASLTADSVFSSAVTLHVHANNIWATPLKVLTLPAKYRHFAYSSELASSRTDNVLVYNGNAYTDEVVRVKDDSPEIYSVKTRSGYSLHDGTNGALPVKLNGSLLPVYKEADMTVTKKVTGNFANGEKSFEFTIYFTDRNGNLLAPDTTFIGEGGTIAGLGAAAPGNVTLNGCGSDTFKLKHGQTMTIKNVPSDVMIKIKETADKIYHATYTDSLSPSVKNENNMEFLISGEYARSFDFTNERIYVVPTGIIEEETQVAEIILPPVFASIIVLSALALINIKRKQKTTV